MGKTKIKRAAKPSSKAASARKAQPRSLDDHLAAPRRRERRPGMRPFPYVTLSAALQKALGHGTLKKHLEVAQIAGAWETLAGAVLAQHVQPVELEKGVLTLEADSSVWRQQVSFMKQELLQKLRDHFKDNLVRSLRLK
jgi:predicted nucleic acid-binding Zn ribbon protein